MYVHVIVFFSFITVQLDTEKLYYLKVSTKSLTVIPPPHFYACYTYAQNPTYFFNNSTAVHQSNLLYFVRYFFNNSEELEIWSKKVHPLPPFPPFFLYIWRIFSVQLADLHIATLYFLYIVNREYSNFMNSIVTHYNSIYKKKWWRG